MGLLSHFVYYEQIAKSWADYLEDMGQGQTSLYMTHLLLVVNTHTKYENGPSSGRKAIEWKRFRLQTDGQTNIAKPIYPS